MRKAALVSVLAVALLCVGTAPSQAWNDGWRGGGHGRVFIGVGPAFWWGRPYPYYWGYYPPAYYPSPPVVVVQEPPVYVTQPPPPPAPSPQAYWYYCASSRGYYPNVQSCPEAWIKVLPKAEYGERSERERNASQVVRRSGSARGAPLRMRVDSHRSERDGDPRQWEELRAISIG